LRDDAFAAEIGNRHRQALCAGTGDFNGELRLGGRNEESGTAEQSAGQPSEAMCFHGKRL